MLNLFEKKRLRLTVKSPIHIGGVHQSITRFEFIKQGQYVYPISEDRLSVFLQEKNLIPHYVSAIEQEGNKFDLAMFFRSKKINLSEMDLMRLSSGKRIKSLGDNTFMQEYRPFIRDGYGKVYIPGTSIKGVIRTALLYKTLKEFKNTKGHEVFSKEVEKIIEEDINQKRNKRKLFQWGNERWFEDFALGGKRRTPNTDWLRMLHLSDAYSSVNIETVLIHINILKKENPWRLKKESSGQNTIIWIECIPENTVFEFEMVWDKGLLREFKSKNSQIHLSDNLEDVLNYVKEWAKDVFNFEMNFSAGHDLQKWYKSNVTNFRIGFGSGMVSTTIAILLNEDLRKKIRNYAGMPRGNDIAPKSRRIWIKDSRTTPLGWAVLEVVS